MRRLSIVTLGACAALALQQPAQPEVVGVKPSEPRPFLRLLDGSGGVEQLPAAFAATWPTWTLDEGGEFARVADASSGDGWVDPASFDDLWQASDLPAPKARLCLGLHVRNGALRHVFPAVDLYVEGGGGERYRNRGLRTLPRAHSWLSVNAALPGTLVLYPSTKAGARAYEAAPTLARAIEALADAPDSLGKGSHVVHAVVAECPPFAPFRCSSEADESRLLLYLSDALFDASDPVELERAAALDVLVVETAAGGESEHLPAAYRGLYAK